MKLKRGFTLIELLAVIVILAVIALIATPIVLNIINNSKNDSTVRSGELYIDAVENAVAKAQLNGTEVSYGTYTINSNGNLSCTSGYQCSVPTIVVEASGIRPNSGTIIIEKGKVVSKLASNSNIQTNIAFDEKIVLYDENNKLVVANTNKKNKTNTPSVPVLTGPKCKRATILHEEVCGYDDMTSGCSGAGYAKDSKIVYGSTGTKGILNSGDAFDCDVDGDGIYNSGNERFYYVSPKDGDSSSEYVTLIYYSNVSGGVADNTNKLAYGHQNTGPQIAMKQLPTTTQWQSISLSTTTRTITNETGGNLTGGEQLYTLPTDYSYFGYAARLLTVQELNNACGITAGLIREGGNRGELDNCKYLIENTNYSNPSINSKGYWLETPHSGNSAQVLFVSSNGRLVSTSYDYDEWTGKGVRPAIEVKKSDIDY